MTTVAQEHPARLQHVVTADNTLIEVSPRIVMSKDALFCGRLPSQNTLATQHLLVLGKKAIALKMHGGSL
jgi:hypothetical protein